MAHSILECLILPSNIGSTFSSRCNVTNELLLDAGALVSILDRSQKGHHAFSDFFRNWAGEVVTTEAVITESTHLLSRVRGGSIACLDFVLSGGALVIPLSQGALRRSREYMEQYADCPMDFADSTLVVLAEDLKVTTILTTDRKGFSVYRIAGRKRFTIPV